jgi:CrcB protein
VSALAWFAVALGAAVGAPLRFVAERRLAATWPRGTFVVNVVGSAVLGVLVGWASSRDADSSAVLVALVGTGFCGALTTFGGYAAQVLDLAVGAGGHGRGPSRAFVYATGSVLACVAVAAAGYLVATSLLA